MKLTPVPNIEAAIQNCANEPVQSPGLIQPFGAILGVRIPEMDIIYASENAGSMFGMPTSALFGTPLGRFVDETCMRSLKAAMRPTTVDNKRVPAGQTRIKGRPFVLHISFGGGHLIVEFEPVCERSFSGGDEFHTVNELMFDIDKAADVAEATTKIAEAFRQFSDYDRVMVYRFDNEQNGEIIAESRREKVESFLGLRFPHWDIPPMARALMAQLPVRFIADVKQTPIPIIAQQPDLPPLDISLAHLRGVSAVHMQYLINMGVRATMTLPIRIGGELWGFISFHHTRPRVPTIFQRGVFSAVMPFFEARLECLLHHEYQKFENVADDIRARVQSRFDKDTSVEWSLEAYAQTILDVFDAQGIFVAAGREEISRGQCPSVDQIKQIRDHARASGSRIWKSNRLPKDLGLSVDDLNGICGAICLETDDGRSVCLFREETIRSVSWAGAPEKKIDIDKGFARLQPRVSFARYIEHISETSTIWATHDERILHNIGHAVLAANQRRLVVAAMRRQKDLIVDELNHRVRNILALVRSISRQTQRQSGSVQSYSSALERRLNALAAAHDLCTRNDTGAVSVSEIIQVEAAPYCENDQHRLRITGQDFAILPEAAPIIALAIHELMTNAAKYGSLSVPEGRVEIQLTRTKRGVALQWIEQAGPPVTAPSKIGFGSMLLGRAVPYELGGKGHLEFSPDGLEAVLELPERLISGNSASTSAPGTPALTDHGPGPENTTLSGVILIVEDNFMIANDLSLTLNELGYQDVELAANLEDARKVIADFDVKLAILDINIGRGGTSEELAFDLIRQNIPFFFVTGYGEFAPLPPELAHHQKLSKPVAVSALTEAIRRSLLDREN